MADKIQEVLDVIKGMTVLELNDLRKAIEEEFDVTAAAPVAVAAAPAAGGGDAGAADEGDAEVSVFVKNPGEKKIEVIKAIRAITGLALKEAKELAESAGAKPVVENVDKAEADKVVEQLKAAGAEVEVK